MPGDAVVRTEELIGNNVDEKGLERMITLRIKAGAITCKVEQRGDEKFLITEWNVIGEQ